MVVAKGRLGRAALLGCARIWGVCDRSNVKGLRSAVSLLKEEGASILGRFFIALLARAALRRAALPAHERRPCFVYVDEATDYFDDKIGHLLN
jgi:hypothetical protein